MKPGDFKALSRKRISRGPGDFKVLRWTEAQIKAAEKADKKADKKKRSIKTYDLKVTTTIHRVRWAESRLGDWLDANSETKFPRDFPFREMCLCLGVLPDLLKFYERAMKGAKT